MRMSGASITTSTFVAASPAAARPLRERVTRKPELLELRAQLVERQAEIHDRAEQHVARGPASAVEVDDALTARPAP